jgi:phage shock protein PspC (stress-responsive transcriptional regulator)
MAGNPNSGWKIPLPSSLTRNPTVKKPQKSATIRLWHGPCSWNGMSNLTAKPKDQLMTNPTPLPLRNDTILGVCEAIGRDFGFNPLWLRLAFIAPIFFVPTATILVYLGLGVVVALTNWFAADKQSEAPHLVSSHELANSDAGAEQALSIAA